MPTKIEWTKLGELTGETWNPLAGCTRISPGCDNCYAIRQAFRNGKFGLPQYQGISTGKDWTGKIMLVEGMLDRPQRWRRPRVIFVCSMSDLFHEKVSDRWRDRIFEVIDSEKRHTFQVLTKRSKNMVRYLKARYGNNAYPSNLWVGVSVESPKYLTRAKDLVKVDPVVRFLSVEPLLSPIAGPLRAWLSTLEPQTLSRLWVIFGGESGHGARPLANSWIMDGVKACRDHGAIPFVKQLGAAELLADGSIIRHRKKRDLDATIIESLGECVREYPLPNGAGR